MCFYFSSNIFHVFKKKSHYFLLSIKPIMLHSSDQFLKNYNSSRDHLLAFIITLCFILFYFINLIILIIHFLASSLSVLYNISNSRDSTSNSIPIHNSHYSSNTSSSYLANSTNSSSQHGPSTMFDHKGVHYNIMQSRVNSSSFPPVNKQPPTTKTTR